MKTITKLQKSRQDPPKRVSHTAARIGSNSPQKWFSEKSDIKEIETKMDTILNKLEVFLLIVISKYAVTHGLSYSNDEIASKI